MLLRYGPTYRVAVNDMRISIKCGKGQQSKFTTYYCSANEKGRKPIAMEGGWKRQECLNNAARRKRRYNPWIRILGFGYGRLQRVMFQLRCDLSFVRKTACWRRYYSESRHIISTLFLEQTL